MITVVRPLLISSCIYPENGRSETLCKSIIATMIEKQKLLDSWRSLHEDRFGTDTHDIPASSELCFSKLNNGGTMTDTCNAARKFNRIPDKSVLLKSLRALLLSSVNNLLYPT